MTIGLAAAGPDAGRAILETLAEVEAFAQGAIGGFVSVAALTDGGEVCRAEIQRGGARTLQAQGPTCSLLSAGRAVLMSSGPDRPTPLSHFTPALSGVGLATGHRFPNTPGIGGRPPNLDVLDLLAAGLAPGEACDRVMARNPAADAGLLVLGLDGRIGCSDSALVQGYPTRGGGVCNGAGWSAGVVHNAIEPHRSLAALTLELMAMRLGSSTLPNHVLPLRAGIVVRRSADRSRVSVRNGRVESIALASSGPADGTWSAGIGPEALLIEAGKVIGITCSDPYLVVRDGLLISADGKSETSLFYRIDAAVKAHPVKTG